MAIVFNFDGKTIIEPGSYARIINGTTQTPTTASSGKVMIIDTGSGAYWGGGSGINGELQNGKNSVYEFDDITDYKNFVQGGLLWDIADYLFNPSNNGQGIPAIQIVRAATTTAASITYTVAGSGNLSKTGTITTTTSSPNVTGVNTKFTTDLRVGDNLVSSTNTVLGVILSITSDTALVLSANATAAVSAAAYKTQYSQPQGGTFTIKTVWEGIGANGYTIGGVLSKGFSAKMSAGIVDSTKFMVLFYTGSYRGVNTVGTGFNYASWAAGSTYTTGTTVYYDGYLFTSLQNSNTGNNPLSAPSYWSLVSSYNDNYGDNQAGTTSENQILQSPEFSSLNDLISWMQTDGNFAVYFKLSSYTINGGGMMDSVDLAANTGHNVATGGTEIFQSSDMDSVLANIAEEDNTFFLADNYQLNAQSVNNTKILGHIINDAEFNKFMVVGGGYDSGQYSNSTGSIGTAAYYNTAKVIVVHSGVQEPKFGGGTKNLPSFYNAALYLGRTAGLDPQVPTTWKDVRMSAPIHELNKRDRERALLAGVVHNKYVDGRGWVVNQSINTLQKNDNLVNADGNSYEVSIERIKAQLNKELVLNSRLLFVGGNYNTASAEDVKLFTEGYLKFRTARPNQDNLIISFQDVKVKLVGDSWQISYGFVPNGPINKLFFTGVILDANLSA